MSSSANTLKNISSTEALFESPQKYAVFTLSVLMTLPFSFLLLLHEAENSAKWFVVVILMRKIITDIHLIFTIQCQLGPLCALRFK